MTIFTNSIPSERAEVTGSPPEVSEGGRVEAIILYASIFFFTKKMKEPDTKKAKECFYTHFERKPTFFTLLLFNKTI
jgi:hypothetical protein